MIVQAELLVDLIKYVAEKIIGCKEELTRLDSAIGDGDLGVNMEMGFSAILKVLPEISHESIDKILVKIGMAYNDAAASSMGVILLTGLLAASKEVQGKREIGISDFAGMLSAAEIGIRNKGKANLGDKTLLDVLIPVRENLGTGLANGSAAADIASGIVMAAEKGLASTVDMQSRMGRAKWIGERTKGHPDPGAAALAMMIKAGAEFLG